MDRLGGLLVDAVTGWQFAAVVMAGSLAVGLPLAAYDGHHTGSPGTGVVLIIGGAGLSVGVPTALGAGTESVFGFFGGGAAGLVVGVGICAVMSARWVRAESPGGRMRH